jgi:alkyl hydroperoxide reductase subunit AhpF
VSTAPHPRLDVRLAFGCASHYNDPMALLTAQDEQAVRGEFERLRDPVKLTVFSQSLINADLCTQNEQLVREVTELSDLTSMEILNLAIDRERAAAYGVDRVPAIVVEGARDYGIRFFGVPSGYEFSNLIDSMIVASTGAPALSEETTTALGSLTAPVHIQVFSTPT